MFEKTVDEVNADDLLEFALGELNMTKDELEEKYKRSRIDKQELEDIVRRCSDFESYCNGKKCSECHVRKFKDRNGLDKLTRDCLLVYEFLFDEK